MLHQRGIIICTSLITRFDTGRMFLRWHRKSGPTYKPSFRTLRTCLRQRATQRAPVLTSISGGWHCLVNQSIQICPPNEAIGSDNALIRWLIAVESLVWLQSSQATGFCRASMLWTRDEFHPAAFALRAASKQWLLTPHEVCSLFTAYLLCCVELQRKEAAHLTRSSSKRKKKVVYCSFLWVKEPLLISASGGMRGASTK